MTCCWRSCVDLDLAAVELRQVEEEVVVLALAEADRRLRAHVDGLELGLGLVLGRADFDAEAQPVQSSAATCSVHFSPFHSGTRASVLLKVAGAP